MSLLPTRVLPADSDIPETGATIDWSPKQEMWEDPQVDGIIAEHGLDPFSPEDREHALDLLALRHYTNVHVAQWSSRIDDLLAGFEPGWQDVPPEEPVLESFELVHALVDDTTELDLSELDELLADEDASNSRCETQQPRHSHMEVPSGLVRAGRGAAQGTPRARRRRSRAARRGLVQ